eukprot:TRINITY_DN1991_c0_g1_i1.p2 TRINITY_DN1991_c0_g1~~TRINITY_DN1991_c0_g1_i1.p2  ORF type:complete len:586 (-),score=160.43 TRINITY_DN1991_c0_g1_i1:3376-5133(-)
MWRGFLLSILSISLVLNAWGRESKYQIYLSVGDDLSQGVKDSLDKGMSITVFLNGGNWGNETQSTVSHQLGEYQELHIVANGTVNLTNFTFELSGNESLVSFSGINLSGNSSITVSNSSVLLDSLSIQTGSFTLKSGISSSISNSFFQSSSIRLENSSQLDSLLEGNRFMNSQFYLRSDTLNIVRNQFNSNCTVYFDSKNLNLLRNSFGESSLYRLNISLGNQIQSFFADSNTQFGSIQKSLPSSSLTLQNVTIRNCSLPSFDLQGGFPALKYLDLSRNSFTFKFPNLLGAKNLKTLNISNCRLSSPLADSFPNEFASLENLDISNNKLRDTTPSGFLSSKTLRRIDFSNNEFHFLGNFTTFELVSCLASGNPFFCPLSIGKNSFNFCKMECYNDHLIESFRIRYDGRRNATSARYLASRIALIANISLSRVNVTREKNQIDADVDILPFGPDDHNEPISFEVVTYLDNLNYTVFAKYGIKGVYDFLFPIPPDRTFTNPVATGTSVRFSYDSNQTAIAAIGIVLLVVAVVFIVAVLIILYLKKKNGIKRDVALSSTSTGGELEMAENETTHTIVELEEDNPSNRM